MLKVLKYFLNFKVLVVVLALIAVIYYNEIVKINEIIREYLKTTNGEIGNDIKTQASAADKVFTSVELSKYNGENGASLYLSILGSVYDVSKGRQHYGPGSSYNYFVGRDASAVFITGEFERFDESSDDVNKLESSDLLNLVNWKGFYDKEYIYKGKLIGRFYDSVGQKTKYHHIFETLVEQAKISKASKDKLATEYPDCNIEWSKETGTKVWCTSMSGGKHRSWSGYPRKLFDSENNSFRCACVKDANSYKSGMIIKPYDDCDNLSDTCYYNVD